MRKLLLIGLVVLLLVSSGVLKLGLMVKVNDIYLDPPPTFSQAEVDAFNDDTNSWRNGLACAEKVEFSGYTQERIKQDWENKDYNQVDTFNYCSQLVSFNHDSETVFQNEHIKIKPNIQGDVEFYYYNDASEQEIIETQEPQETESIIQPVVQETKSIFGRFWDWLKSLFT